MTSIYLAGPMAKEADRGAIADWRLHTKSRVEGMFPWLALAWLFPETAGCDHRGIDMFGTAAADLDLVEASDIVVAWLDDVNRAGTIAEIGMARALHKKVGVLVNKQAHQAGLAMDEQDWPQEFYDTVTRTNHGCWCLLDPVMAGHLWFPMALGDYAQIYSPNEQVPDRLAQLIALLVLAKEPYAWDAIHTETHSSPWNR